MNTRKLTHLLALGIVAGCNSGGEKITPPPPPPPPEPTVTITYEIADFTSVALNGSFDVTMRQGDEYFVEVTIDTKEANKLDVAKGGDHLNVGFLPGSDVRAATLEAVIVMPAIHALELRGSNHVEMAGFNGGTVDLAINGNNFLGCRDSAFDFVTANVSGSSLLEIVNVAPTPAAHIELSGSSSATINLMDFAAVTGSLAGTSALLYYGSNVIFDMNVANTASVTRLGATL